MIKTDDSQWQVLSVPCGVGLSLVGLHHNDIVVSLLLKLLPQVHALGREEGHGRGGGILTYQQLCWVVIGAYSSNEQKSRLFRVYMGIIVKKTTTIMESKSFFFRGSFDQQEHNIE